MNISRKLRAVKAFSQKNHVLDKERVVSHYMDKQISGTQVLSRASTLLKLVSKHSPDGISSSEIAKEAQLTRPTTHRLLTSLAGEGFLDFDSTSAKWHLGPELFLLGNLAAKRYDITEIARPIVREIADLTGESSFLSARRGNETVCILREEGAFPIRSFVLYEGVRFPLGIASAGLAILSFMSDTEIGAYLKSSEKLSEVWGVEHGNEQIVSRISLTRSRGFALNPGLILQGSWGIGAAVFDAAGVPQWSLSITGIESRFTGSRLNQMGNLLVHKAHQLTSLINGPR